MKLFVPLLICALAGCAFDVPQPFSIDRAWWSDPGTLRISLWSPGAGSFVLATSDRSVTGAHACIGARCVVTFEDAHAPEQIFHLGEHRSVAPVNECGEEPFGLCPFGHTCVDRACVPLCSPTYLDGACINDGAVCLDGWCGFLGEQAQRTATQGGGTS